MTTTLTKSSARNFMAMATALAFAAATLAPTGAEARERRGGYDDRGGYGEDYRNDRHRDGYRDGWRHRRDRHDRHDSRDEALAAGLIGLVLGVALGAATSQPRQPEARCTDNYQRCEPPARGYQEGGAYERDYGAAPAAPCIRRERQWDRYANRYVTVDVPC
jgi:hypothetical protein